MAYIRCPVRPYIPNPLLLSVPTIRPLLRTSVGASLPALVAGNRATTAQIAKEKKEQCLNCKGEHPAYSRSCPTWITERKEITAVKIKKISYQRQGVLFCHARRSLNEVIAKPISKSPPPAKKIIQRTESDSPRKPKSRSARQRDLKPHLTRIPKKLSRDFHRKIEEDTLTGDCSEDDEDLMDIQSGPSTSSSRGGASAAQ
ncbi:hypothetical protein TNCV_3247051 [Trichonephila clavipes]|nr:hypothetical protein TNCV_3247051 [Trichonephila clavipes]